MASKVFYRDFYGDIEKDAFLNLNNKYRRWLNIATLGSITSFYNCINYINVFLGKVDDIPTKETPRKRINEKLPVALQFINNFR